MAGARFGEQNDIKHTLIYLVNILSIVITHILSAQLNMTHTFPALLNSVCISVVCFGNNEKISHKGRKAYPKIKNI